MKKAKWKIAWEIEKKNYLGDYGDSTEYDLECSFRAGFEAGQKQAKQELWEDIMINGITHKIKKKHNLK